MKNKTLESVYAEYRKKMLDQERAEREESNRMSATIASEQEIIRQDYPTWFLKETGIVLGNVDLHIETRQYEDKWFHYVYFYFGDRYITHVTWYTVQNGELYAHTNTHLDVCWLVFDTPYNSDKGTPFATLGEALYYARNGDRRA